MNQSPYATALGADRLILPAELQRYFDTIPVGYTGHGAGTFDVVGTPRRWLQILLHPLDIRGVVPAGFWREVQFTVENRTEGTTAVGIRTFHLPGRDWVMTDRVSSTRSGVVDTLGVPPTVAAAFSVSAMHGKVALRSTKIGLRLGPLRLNLPRWCSPTMTITESFRDRQGVAATIDMPLIGRIYEYTGTFTYEIRKDQE